MNCHYCCPNHHNLKKGIRNKESNYMCDICKSEFNGSQILYSCTSTICDFDVCNNCSLKPYSIGFRGLLAKDNLLDAFEKNNSTNKNLYRDIISAQIYHKAQKWNNFN
jgi:hypothetical protein